MKQVELIEKRKPREKHFLREDGTILAEVYDMDIHYLKDGKYEEIDNALVRENGVLRNKSNDYNVEFKENFKDSLIKMTKDNHYIDFKIRESNTSNLKSEKRKLSKQMQNVTYNNITDDIAIEYQTLSNKVKETIILQNAKYSKISFELDTNLNLIEKNGEIIARDENKKIVFKIEKPFMIDSNKIRNDNIYYRIEKFNELYLLTLILDDEWLNSNERKFPVYIDPTITNNSQNTSLYDTYIYPGDSDDVRYNRNYLKAGVEKVNGNIRPNRTLIKFSLPTIGTGSEIVYATLDLTSYPTVTQHPTERVATIHRVTTDWNEDTANWNSMNDKFEQRVESIFYGSRSIISGDTIIPHSSYYDGNITNLVKKWYRDTPNYGVMIKSVDESKYVDEDYPIFYSKDNTLSNENNPKPIFSLVYRSHNGLEDYLDYKEQIFTDGVAYVNTYNGNLITIFNLGHTIGGNLPINLGLVYNTNDVILNNKTFFKKGYKLTLEQNIKDITIDENNYLEYLDEDGTLHYFNKESNTNYYYDEDGLNLTIEKSDSMCTMTDNNGSKMLFTKIGDIYRLTKIIDTNENYINIILNDDHSISKIIDMFNNEVNITYNIDNIIITSPDMVTTLNYTNNLLTSITTISGTTVFEYNSTGIISTITDSTGLKIKYEYYLNSPYRVSKIIQIGLNGTIGENYSLKYGFDSTSIIDNRGKTTTLIYNSYGNVLSRSSMINGEDVDNAYSINQTYGKEGKIKNRILSSELPIRYIKNYLKNASFESDIDYFKFDNENITKSYSTEECVSGNRSLRIDTLLAGQTIEQIVSLPKGKFYTFSGYFKNLKPMILSLSYLDKDGKFINEEQNIDFTNEFVRNDLTIFYDDEATSDLTIKFKFPSINTAFIDDIQLEEGEVANGFNMIENPDFSDGYSDWKLDAWTYGDGEVTPDSSFSIVKFNDNKSTALKISTNPTYGVKFTKIISIKGKKGDLYTCSFWYKNLGIPGYGQIAGSIVSIYFKPVGHDADYCIATSDSFNPNEDKWQFFTYRSHAPEDFESIKLVFLIGREANDFYLTNLSLYKDITSGEYNYDDNGNLVSIIDQSNNTNVFKYNKNNQLISMTNTLGKNFKYEYDNKKSDRVLSAISSNGISNKVIYDGNGNPVTTRISKRYKKKITDGLYKIRNKGTNKYLKAELNMVLSEENECSNTLWKLEQNGDYYKILYSIQPDYSISFRNGKIVLDQDDTNNLFQLEENTDSSNGTYYIKYNEMKSEGTIVRFLTVNGVKVEANLPGDLSSDMEFYIELKDELFIENSAEYTDDGRFIKKVIDNDFSEVTYNINLNTGLLNSMTDFSGNTINYSYNDKKQLTSVSSGDRTINYNYNDKNLLSKIKSGNSEYNFTYDEFLNQKSILIGNNITFITNDYEKNNGNLSSTTFGNGQKIAYEYDDFDRINSINKMNDTFNYKYDNNGNISKILSNGHMEKCEYDASNRLYKYSYDNFKINYVYNSEDEVTGQSFKLDDSQHFIENTFDDEGFLTKSILDNNEINYYHDDFGRLTSIKLLNNYKTNYEYVSKGKKTTDTVRSLKNGNNKYYYKYDRLNNITHQYYNNNLINQYYYDEYNQLIRELDYSNGLSIGYTYDNYGNLLTVTTKKLNSNELVEMNNYEYSNDNWLDQLTSYNGKKITYDVIGNPTSIGEDISMNWVNGRELNNYINNSTGLNINYKYDANGIRTSKIVNGIENKYYLEGENIIYEKKSDALIYYLYDYTGLIGLNYNGENFYYVKNLQGDIIGILNSNSEQVVTYEYDSWGKVLSVKDALGNLINNPNNIGYINPFRYRGYYYDTETNLYYLNSRYYNPEWKRFINADIILCANADIISPNLYAYVSNNPIMYSDSTGHGILKKIKKAIKKTLKKAIKTVKNIAKSVIKKVTNLFSYNVSGSVSTTTDSVGINGYVRASSGESVSISKSFVGNNDSLIQVTSDLSDPSNISQEYVLNGILSTLKITMSPRQASVSSGIKYKNKTYNLNAGMENFELYGGYQVDETNGDCTTGNFGKISVNAVPIVVLAIFVTVKIPIPAIKKIPAFIPATVYAY